MGYVPPPLPSDASPELKAWYRAYLIQCLERTPFKTRRTRELLKRERMRHL